jgi:hypothetical protein
MARGDSSVGNTALPQSLGRTRHVCLLGAEESLPRLQVAQYPSRIGSQVARGGIVIRIRMVAMIGIRNGSIDMTIWA